MAIQRVMRLQAWTNDGVEVKDERVDIGEADCGLVEIVNPEDPRTSVFVKADDLKAALNEIIGVPR